MAVAVIAATPRCPALGCGDKPGKSAVFCTTHWRMLPENLRGPAAVRDAIAWLGVKEGYLIAPRGVTRR